jgi:hypothetical protein
MVTRCKPPGCAPSNIVALWKDPAGGLTEIALDEGAQGILLTCNVSFGSAHTADGRRHPASTTEFTLVAVQSLHADVPRCSSDTGPGETASGPPESLAPLREDEVSKAISWAEAVAESALAGPEGVNRTIADATDDMWRRELGLRPPSAMFVESVAAIRSELPEAAGMASLMTAAGRLQRSSNDAEVLAGTVINLALEERVMCELRAGRLSFDEVTEILQGAG